TAACLKSASIACPDAPKGGGQDERNYGTAQPEDQRAVKIVVPHSLNDRRAPADQPAADPLLDRRADIAEDADKSHGSPGGALGRDVNREQAAQGSNQAIDGKPVHQEGEHEEDW